MHLLQSNPKTADEARDIIGQSRDEIGNFVRKMLGANTALQEEDIEDLISSCWLEIYSKIPEWYDPTKSKIETPIYTRVYWIVNRFMKNFSKNNEKHKDFVLAIESADSSYEDDSYDDGVLMNTLENNCKVDGTLVQRILYHRYKENKTWDDISVITGVPRNSAIKTAEQWCEKVIGQL